jgi:alkylhydroperoxidase family enzyme
MTGWDEVAGVDHLRVLAPEAFEALERMRDGALGMGVADRTAASTAVAMYADQFNIDVASLTAEQRAAAGAVLGDALFGFVQAVWALDMADRIDHAWRQLVPSAVPDRSSSGSPSAAPIDHTEMWSAVEAFLPAVGGLAALDPVTTEIVRLRGARAHDCRLCRSLRSVHAIEAGADDDTFDAIDRYETSDLDERLKVALRLVDAMIWEPRSWRDGLAAEVKATFTPAEAIEIVFDVVRNGANKIAVALEADQAHVAEGVEYFSMDPAGDLTYGLDRPASPSSERVGRDGPAKPSER